LGVFEDKNTGIKPKSVIEAIKNTAIGVPIHIN
jgi:hypothetical protein